MLMTGNVKTFRTSDSQMPPRLAGTGLLPEDERNQEHGSEVGGGGLLKVIG